MTSDTEKREAVRSEVRRTGVTCYPSGYRNKEGCLRCGKGPCVGPLEKWKEERK